MLKVALSHDIDRTSKSYQWLTKPARSLISLNGNAILNQVNSLFKKNTYWNFEEIIEIENKFNVKSTFFFLNETMKLDYFDLKSYPLALGRYNIESKKITTMIQWLDQNGWEIGVHGSYASFNNLNLLQKEKLVLESILGHSVKGIRQHYLNLTDETWRLQDNAGFLYDSSLGFAASKGYKNKIGFRDNHVRPFFSNPNSNFLEIPLVIMDTNFMNLRNKWEDLKEIVNQCKKLDGVIVINYHNHVFNDLEYPGFKSSYINLIEYFLSEGATFYKMEEIYDLYKNN